MKKHILTTLFLAFTIIISFTTYCCGFPTKYKHEETNDFYEFSRSFINSPFLQIIFSNEFVALSHMDTYSSELPTKITKFVDKNEIYYPIIPSSKTMHEYDQKIEIILIDEKNAHIVRSKDDTGLLVKYHFYKCKFWILYMIQDESI